MHYKKLINNSNVSGRNPDIKNELFAYQDANGALNRKYEEALEDNRQFKVLTDSLDKKLQQATIKNQAVTNELFEVRKERDELLDGYNKMRSNQLHGKREDLENEELKGQVMHLKNLNDDLKHRLDFQASMGNTKGQTGQVVGHAGDSGLQSMYLSQMPQNRQSTMKGALPAPDAFMSSNANHFKQSVAQPQQQIPEQSIKQYATTLMSLKGKKPKLEFYLKQDGILVENYEMAIRIRTALVLKSDENKNYVKHKLEFVNKSKDQLDNISISFKGDQSNFFI